MATALSDIIFDAYRDSNIIAKVSEPDANETSEAVILLNRLIASVVGSEAGFELTDIQIGGQYGVTLGDYIPEDARLVLNLTGDETFKLHPLPRDGQRFAIVDGDNTLGTYNVTLDANGRKIEGAATFDIVTTDDDEQTVVDAGQWFYRADLANWVKITDLGEDDDMPFPTEYDDYVTLMLALRLNPRHGETLSQESLNALQRQEQQLQARYRKRRTMHELPTLGLMGSGFGGGASSFNAGLLR